MERGIVLMKEYELMQNLRLYRTSIMFSWRQILIPSATAIPPLSAVAAQAFNKNWLVGWWTSFAFGLLLLVFWLYIDNLIDKDIVSLYRRFLELEENLGMKYYSEYIVRALNRKLPEVPTIQGELNNNKPINYTKLYELIDKYPKRFVSSRGRYINWLLVGGFFVVGITIGVLGILFSNTPASPKALPPSITPSSPLPISKDSILTIIGIILAYLGIFLTLLGISVGLYYQGKVLENPKEQALLGRKIKRTSFVFFIAAGVFLCILLYIFGKFAFQ